jgi:hypothetical protein
LSTNYEEISASLTASSSCFIGSPEIPQYQLKAIYLNPSLSIIYEIIQVQGIQPKDSVEDQAQAKGKYILR